MNGNCIRCTVQVHTGLSTSEEPGSLGASERQAGQMWEGSSVTLRGNPGQRGSRLTCGTKRREMAADTGRRVFLPGISSPPTLTFNATLSSDRHGRLVSQAATGVWPWATGKGQTLAWVRGHRERGCKRPQRSLGLDLSSLHWLCG